MRQDHPIGAIGGPPLHSSLPLLSLKNEDLLAQGEHPKVVSERLGHASTTLTLDAYSDVFPTMQQQVAEKLETMRFGASTKAS